MRVGRLAGLGFVLVGFFCWWLANDLRDRWQVTRDRVDANTMGWLEHGPYVLWPAAAIFVTGGLWRIVTG